MSKEKKKAKPDHKHIPLILWCIIGIVILFLFITPFNKALFNGYTYTFEQPIYSAVLLVSLGLLLLGVHFFRSLRLETHRDLLAVIVWLVPLFYFISMFSAASYHLARFELNIRVMWAAFFTIGAYIARSTSGARTIQLAILGSGYLLTIYGYLNWFGNASYTEALLQGNRLSNVFQYPNSYAAYLVALVMITLVVLNTSRGKFVFSMTNIFLLPLVLSFCLTLSRGAIIVFPIIVFIYFIFIPWTKQIVSVLYLGVSFITSMLLFKPMTSIRARIDQQFEVSTSLKGWMLLVGATIVVAVINYIINRYISRRLERKYHQENTFTIKNFPIPILVMMILVIFAIALLSGSKIVEILPEQVQIRVWGINEGNSSVFARDTFNNDAMKVIGDYPLFGAGGGAWSVLYESYKSYPYTSSQVHNFFLQYLIESGVVGILLLSIIVLYVITIFVLNIIRTRERKNWDETRIVFPLISLVILGHSLLDFDMSFGYLSSIVFLGLGATVASDSLKLSWFEQIKGSIQSRWRIGYSSLLVMVSLILAGVAIQSLSADASYKKALKLLQQTGDYNQLVVPLNAAIKKAPSQPIYVFTKVDILRQLFQQTRDENFLLEATELLQKLKSNEAYNREVVLREYGIYMDAGKVSDANKIITDKLLERPWDIQFYELAVVSYFEMGRTAEQQSDVELKDQYWDSAIEVLDTVSDKESYINTRSENEKKESRHFKLTPTMVLTVAKIHYYREQYQKASDILLTVLNGNYDDPINKETMRWFLASLKKQGKWHEGSYNTLIANDPNEAIEIDKIVNSQE